MIHGVIGGWANETRGLRAAPYPRSRRVTCVKPLLALLAGALGTAVPVASYPAQEKTTAGVAGPIRSERELLEHLSEIPRLIARRQLMPQDIPNPHWRRDACRACHNGTPSRTNHLLRDKDINRLCNNCHEIVSPHSYIHTVGARLPTQMLNRMPGDVRHAIARGGGVVSCVACHDLRLQCLAVNAPKRNLNPLFFRGGPFRTRTDLCFRCHDLKAYPRLNPHDQIDASGKRREERCLVCHEHVPDLEKTAAEADFNVTGDLKILCTGCHQLGPHPGGNFALTRKGGVPNHLVIPPEAIARRMREQSHARRLTLPLDPNTGKVFCGTCHNPHAAGVIKGVSGAGAGTKRRLRSQHICELCHDK